MELTCDASAEREERSRDDDKMALLLLLLLLLLLRWMVTRSVGARVFCGGGRGACETIP